MWLRVELTRGFTSRLSRAKLDLALWVTGSMPICSSRFFKCVFQ
jgi:hypothetical protein